MFRFCYSRDFLKWALCPPGYRTDWHVGVRVKASQKLVRAACVRALRHQHTPPPQPTHTRNHHLAAPHSCTRAAGGLYLGHPCQPARQRHGGGHGRDKLPLCAQEAARQAPHAGAHQGGDAQGQPLRRLARRVHGGGGDTQARGDVPLLPPLHQPQKARRHRLLELQRAHHHGPHDPPQQAARHASDRRRAPIFSPLLFLFLVLSCGPAANVELRITHARAPQGSGRYATGTFPPSRAFSMPTSPATSCTSTSARPRRATSSRRATTSSTSTSSRRPTAASRTSAASTACPPPSSTTTSTPSCAPPTCASAPAGCGTHGVVSCCADGYGRLARVLGMPRCERCGGRTGTTRRRRRRR